MSYLLAARRPAWVKYVALVKLAGLPPDDPEVRRWRDKRDASAYVARIRARQNPDGSFLCMPWAHVHEYYFHNLLEMGYGLDDPAVRRSADNLLDYQLPDGGYMHPHSPRVNVPNPEIGWSPCTTGYITRALLNLGLGSDPRVQAALDVMQERQRDNGGWICRHVGERAPYCIIGGTPWVFDCLARAGRITSGSPIAQGALRVLERHKAKIIRHGYAKDHYYRCDEALLLGALKALGLSPSDPLVRDLLKSLADKQQPDGTWPFRGRPSGWYTIEAAAALSLWSR